MKAQGRILEFRVPLPEGADLKLWEIARKAGPLPASVSLQTFSQGEYALKHLTSIKRQKTGAQNSLSLVRRALELGQLNETDGSVQLAADLERALATYGSPEFQAKIAALEQDVERAGGAKAIRRATKAARAAQRRQLRRYLGRDAVKVLDSKA